MQKSYNLDSQLGGDTDDMELVQRYGINPELAYTSGINEAIFKAVHDESVRDGIEGGLTPEQAMKSAMKSSGDARAVYAQLCKDGKVK